MRASQKKELSTQCREKGGVGLEALQRKHPYLWQQLVVIGNTSDTVVVPCVTVAGNSNPQSGYKTIKRAGSP